MHSTGIKKLHHHVIGDIDLPYESLPLEAGATTNLVTYLPGPGSPAHDALTRLAGWVAEHTSYPEHPSVDRCR